jgi:AraC family transcriptional regulator
MRQTLPQGSFYGKKQIGCEVAGISFTEYEFPPNLQIPPHSHESTYFYLVLRGAFTEVYGKKTRTGAPSTVIFSPAGERHSDVWHDRGGRCFNVEFELEWLERVRQHSAVLDDPRDFRSGAPVVRLATRLYREFQELDAASPLALEGLTLEILAEASRQPLSAAERRPPGWLRRAKDLLHDRFTENLSLDDIAAAAGVHPTHLARAFRRHYHCTIGDYLRGLRIEWARHELSTSDIPLIEIAVNSGYCDQSHFSTAFKRHIGMTPTEYRRIFRPR